MKTLKIVLMVALAIVVASVFTGAVSAADQTDSQLIVKDENADFRAVHQTTGQNESGNIYKIDLNGIAKPEEAVSVENSTISESNNSITDIAPVQSADNSTEIGKEANSSDLQSENSRKLTNKGKMSVKAQGWLDDLWNGANKVIDKAVEVYDKLTTVFTYENERNQTNGKTNITEHTKAKINIPIAFGKSKTTKKITKKKKR